VFTGLAPARRRLLLAVLVTALVASVAAGALLFSRTSRQVTPTDQARPGPVLLVPGYGGSTASLSELADRLTAAGRDATVVTLPGNGTGDLAAAARALGDTVKAVLARTGAPDVDLIGYSAGGIVVRLWVADDAGAATTRRVLTLGSPHHGTTLADLATEVAADACPAACRQLATGSDLLRRLNAGDETPAGPTWVSIWTTGDQTVTPPDSARLSGALNLSVQSVCPTAQVSHSDLPRSALVQAMVLAELGAGEPVPLTTADCARLAG
jgi:triacylglycerol lipase